MAYNYIPKYIRQSENKSPKSVVTASRWNELFNLLIKQGDHTAEELGKILDYLSTELEDLTSEKLDKTGGVITGNLGVTGKLNIGATVAITETNINLLQLAGDYGAPVTISNVDTPVADNDAATKKYVDERAGESVLYVNITQSGSAITGDKTYAEILAAVTAGKCVIAKLAGMSFCLDSVSNDKITFQRLDIVEDDGEGRRSIQKTLIYVYNDGVWTGDVEFVAVDTAMSDTSRMPVQNKVVKAYIDGLVGGGGTSDHSQLTNRDAANQHPITAITGLQTALNSKADVADIPSLEDYATEAYVQNYHDNTKQDIINDLATIRSGASKGATAVQPETGKGLFSGSYNDLTDKPAIPDAVTEGTVSGWGFTKNTGTYSKPADGIPKSDLAAAVQTSLDKADSALQKVPIGYRTAAAQDAIDRGKVDKVDGKGLSSNDYTAAAKSKVDAIPANPKYTDTVYDDTALKERIATIEGKESAWDAKSDFSGSYNDLTDKPTIPTALPNPNAITFTGAVTGSYDGSAPMTVNIPSAVTDAHINSLIDTKLGVIENGSY